jgi:hypothetical protein
MSRNYVSSSVVLILLRITVKVFWISDFSSVATNSFKVFYCTWLDLTFFKIDTGFT